MYLCSTMYVRVYLNVINLLPDHLCAVLHSHRILLSIKDKAFDVAFLN